MPQLTVRGIDADTMAAISKQLLGELAAICDCGADNFTVDILQVTSVFDGQTTATYPFIEVAWFDRGRAVRDRFAGAVTRHLRAAGVSDLEIAFKVYREDAYYANGQSFD